MSFSTRAVSLSVFTCLLLIAPSAADAQIVRRFMGGGVQVNAPFVRVNVGPGGATSVRAPFTSVNAPGRYGFGRRRLLYPNRVVQPRPYAQPPTRQPTPVDVDSLPYPTVEQLEEMNDEELVETLREMMGRFNHRLSRLKTGEGWQKYLVLSREVLGAPGAKAKRADLDAIRSVLPRYESVQNDSQFTKIAGIPSFVAVFAALEEAEQRLAKLAESNQLARKVESEQTNSEGDFPAGPQINDPNVSETGGNQSIATEDATGDETPAPREPDPLPTPTPADQPSAAAGEHSILNRQ